MGARFARASSRNTLRACGFVQQLPLQDIESCTEYQNIEQRSLLCDAGSEHDTTDLSKLSAAARKKEVLAFSGRKGPDTSDEYIQFASKLRAIKLKNEEL